MTFLRAPFLRFVPSRGNCIRDALFGQHTVGMLSSPDVALIGKMAERTFRNLVGPSGKIATVERRAGKQKV